MYSRSQGFCSICIGNFTVRISRDWRSSICGMNSLIVFFFFVRCSQWGPSDQPMINDGIRERADMSLKGFFWRSWEHCTAVSSRGGDLSCRQYDQPNEAVIASRWCRCWEEKRELKLWCRGSVYVMWCRESSSDRSCGSGLISSYAVDK